MGARESSPTHPLVPYVPRVLSEWDIDAPGSMWQQIDGSLCFVDISGFTRLSEALARRGRIGAEELTDVLDRVFGEMLRLAYQRGGSLLKFGGDALLLLFEGDGHAVQAASSAVEMRAELRQAVRIETSVGRIALKMSVGVHTGPIDLFRVGESHHELIITGSAATTTTEMEAAADAGEIVISGAMRSALAAGSATQQKGSGWLLRWRTARVDPVGPVLRRTLSAKVIDQCVPTQLRRHLSTVHGEPEHRIATVGFLEFKGIRAELERNGPDGVARALDQLISSVQQAADEEGVTFLSTDIDDDGGKVILTTGVPATREDDEGRMLRAVRRIADSGPTLPLKIGVNRGHVFAGEIGTDVRRTYTVMGDTVNLAARLMAAAPPGAVYAAPSVLDRSRTLFDTTQLEPFHVKGKSEPVRAYAMGSEAGVREEEDHGILPFVGRESELETLTEAISGLASGTGGAAVVSGDTGIGKTRLVEEAVSDRNVDTFLVRAEPNSSGNPYWAFRDPLRALLGIERRTQAEMAHDLERVIRSEFDELASELPLIGSVAQIQIPDNEQTRSIDPRYRPDRTADVLIRLLERRFPKGVFIAEDCHWMDEASWHLVKRLASAADSRGWLVVATTREESIDLAKSPVASLRLSPLSPENSRSAIVAVTQGAPLRVSELDAVVTRSGGNPLFLGEIIRVIRESGKIDDLPESLDAVVGAEIDALAPLPRRLLRMSSVLGRSFRRAVLEAFMAPEEMELDAATIRSLARFVEADGADRFRFRHATLHQVAYEGLSYRRRRELHERAGRVIERLAGDDPAAVAEFLALHYAEARRWDSAWKFAVIAGDRAASRHANVEAVAQYGVAVIAAKRLEPEVDAFEVARIHEAIGDAAEIAGLYEDADRAFTNARRVLADDAEAVGRLMAKQGLIREKAGKLPAALAWFRRGLNLLERENATGGHALPELRVAYGGIRFRQGRYHDAIDWCLQALDDPGVTDEQRGHALHLLVTAYAHVGAPEAIAVGEQAVEIYERVGDLVGLGNVLNNLGVNAFYRGRWDESAEYHTRAGDVRRRAGHVVGAAASVNNLAEIYCDQGKLEQAEEMFREALYVFESSEFPVGVALASANLGRTLTRMGNHEEAWTHLDRGRVMFVEMGAQAFVHETDVKIAEHHLLGRRYDDARAVAEAALASMKRDESTLMARTGLLRVVAYCAVADGDLSAAEHVFNESLELAREADARFEQALTYEGMARTLHGHTLATEWNARQVELLEQLGVIATPVIPLA